MNVDLSNLPDNASELRELFVSYRDESEKRRQSQELKIDWLEERIRLLQNELFGRKSEKSPIHAPDQMGLFESADAEPVVIDSSTDDDITIPEHTRRKRGRKPLPKDLPRVDVVHDLAEDKKVCACGCRLSKIGQEVAEKLDIVPAKIRVLRHIRLKYACKDCEGVEDDGPAVRIAPVPAQMIPKGIASEGLLAHVIVAKFADALPLYRQEKIFDRLGVDLCRATMSNWVITAANACQPLLALMQKEMCSGPLINADETPLQVLKEPGRSNTGKSYMWVYVGGAQDRPVRLYQYHPTRSGTVALEFLKDYRGYVQSDAFSGYDHLDRKDDIRLLGCWAHVRRKFMDVVKAKKKVRSSRNPKSLADDALVMIGSLYHVEKYAREKELNPDEIHMLRREKSEPVLEQFKIWLDKNQPVTPPKGLLGKAIQYALNHWPKLTVYIEKGWLPIDNNIAENAIRPFVVGRKNWLFAGHPRGASASAAFFSLIETAKANGLEPYSYLRYLFENLPLAANEADHQQLLPQYVDTEALAVAKRGWG
jgi:transposase